ncbi:MAG: flagellar motor protein MotB [Sphingomonas sp.]|nr:MAG: flagellar motor protein MotB [Sphingomonas sp.]
MLPAPATAPVALPPQGAPAPSFDIAKIVVSSAPLGAFPYLGLPNGYKAMNKPTTIDYGHFPFWDGTALHWVEGRVFYESIDTAKGKPFSPFELQRNLEAEIAQAGGAPVAEGKIPPDVAKTIGRDVTIDMNGALGDIYNDPVKTWAIRRADREIWLHFTATSAMGTLTVVETKPFVATARLLPAAELKADIDGKGKAILHVNFDTDKAVILPASQPQIAEIVALLKSEPALRLAINGYTDATGAADHNVALSQARAKAVAAAIEAAGILTTRLDPHGFGDSQPVAANDTEDGKAQNRRVELVKL